MLHRSHSNPLLIICVSFGEQRRAHLFAEFCSSRLQMKPCIWVSSVFKHLHFLTFFIDQKSAQYNIAASTLLLLLDLGQTWAMASYHGWWEQTARSAIAHSAECKGHSNCVSHCEETRFCFRDEIKCFRILGLIIDNIGQQHLVVFMETCHFAFARWRHLRLSECWLFPALSLAPWTWSKQLLGCERRDFWNFSDFSIRLLLRIFFFF